MINRKKKNNKGFTLVELLVVIAIIGILAVVAVPSLFKNINKAKASEAVAYVSAVKSTAVSVYADNTTPRTFSSEELKQVLDDIEDEPDNAEVTSIDISDKGVWTIDVTVANDDIKQRVEKMSTSDTVINATVGTITQ